MNGTGPNNTPNPWGMHAAGTPTHSSYGDAWRGALGSVLNLARARVTVPLHVRNGADAFGHPFGALPGSVRWPAQTFALAPAYAGATYLAQQGGFDKPRPWEG